MKHLILAFCAVALFIASCKKSDPYDTNLTARLVGAYVGTLDSTIATTTITRVNDNTLHFDVAVTGANHLRFDSVAMVSPSTFVMYGNDMYAGAGKFQGNILSYNIRAYTDTTELRKFYGNK